MDLRGASADSLSVASGKLRRLVTSGADAAAIADDLFMVATTVREEPTLRRVLTDVSIAAEAKQGLVREILAGKAGQDATGLVAEAVALRWTVGRDLPGALELLGEIAAVLSAGNDGDRLSDELFAVKQLVDENPELRDALGPGPVRR